MSVLPATLPSAHTVRLRPAKPRRAAGPAHADTVAVLGTRSRRPVLSGPVVPMVLSTAVITAAVTSAGHDVDTERLQGEQEWCVGQAVQRGATASTHMHTSAHTPAGLEGEGDAEAGRSSSVLRLELDVAGSTLDARRWPLACCPCPLALRIKVCRRVAAAAAVTDTC